MPDLICMNLQEAQDLLQELTGDFFASNSTDDSGDDRFQVVDRNWTVVRSVPSAGSEIVSAPDLYVLKKSEVPDCGAAGQAAPSNAVAPTSAPTSVPPTATPRPVPTPAPALTPISFDEISQAERSMTDIKWDRFTEETENTRAASRWVGTVVDVDNEIFGSDFYVVVDMDGDGILDVKFDVNENVALSLDKGQRIEFSGDIDDIVGFLGVTVDLTNAEIH